MVEKVRAVISDLVAHARRVGADAANVEIKRSVGKLPKSIAETLSAFANGSGGWIILGLDEQDGFLPAPDFAPLPIRDALAGACADQVHPPLRPDIHIVTFEGQNLVVSYIEPLPPNHKPCYVKERGTYRGSYIRTGDGDRRLSNYEVDRLIEEHRQPRWDMEVVSEATPDNLDKNLTAQLLSRLQRSRPRLFFEATEVDVLKRLKVLALDEKKVPRPTLAGLLALGIYPQEFFPRLTVALAVFPGVSKAPVPTDQRRMLDTQLFAGPIPDVVEECVRAVMRSTMVGAHISGVFRIDAPEYPLPAVREAVVNALMHRDYSPDSHGSHVQINVFTDRLEVVSPGGLYGGVSLDRLGTEGISATRNQFLSTLLEDVALPGGGYVAENRGTGFAVMRAELASAGMSGPEVADSLTHFSLTFSNARMTAMSHAGRVLGHSPQAPSQKKDVTSNSVRDVLLEFMAQRDLVSAAEAQRALGLSRSTVLNHLRSLVAEGVVERTEPLRSPNSRYRLK